MSTRHATTIDREAQAGGTAADAPLLLDEEAFRGFYDRTTAH